jgi:hypothetical protein
MASKSGPQERFEAGVGFDGLPQVLECVFAAQ